MRKEPIARRTSIALPEELVVRLEAQSAQTGATVAELIRRAVAAVTPPIVVHSRDQKTAMAEMTVNPGHVFVEGLSFDVHVLDVRQNRLLVEPVAGSGQSWLAAERVIFEDR